MRAGETPAWTLIIVPPRLTASTRRVGLKMRTLRMFGMLLLFFVLLVRPLGIWGREVEL